MGRYYRRSWNRYRRPWRPYYRRGGGWGRRRYRGGRVSLGGMLFVLVVLGVLAFGQMIILIAAVLGATYLGVRFFARQRQAAPEADLFDADAVDSAPSKVAIGRQGEQEVRYVLQWLDSRYRVLHDVRLKAPGYDRQQFDHIVIGPTGVFHLETKNFGGTIRIDPHGVWTQQKPPYQQPIRITSPVFQAQRHNRVLSEILGGDVPVRDLIVLANRSAQISGQEHSPVPVVTSDMLLHHLQQEGPAALSEADVDRLYQRVLAHQA